MGIGFELYQWAAERGLELPLLIFSIIVLAVLLIIAAKFNFEPCIPSLCRNCKYIKSGQGCYTLTCGFYKPKTLFTHRKTHCPFEQMLASRRAPDRTIGA